MQIVLNIIVCNPFFNGTSMEYDLQPVYDNKGFIGVITELSQVCLAIYDIPIEPVTYTSSKNIDITSNQIPLHFPMELITEL